MAASNGGWHTCLGDASGNMWSSWLKARQWTTCLPTWDCPAKTADSADHPPLCHGGLGLSCTAPVECSAATLPLQPPHTLPHAAGLDPCGCLKDPAVQIPVGGAAHLRGCPMAARTLLVWPHQPGHYRWGPEKVRLAFCQGTCRRLL
jgi:hypothetical protein